MEKLYSRVILLFLLINSVPALSIAQCTDSAYFTVKQPYCIGTAASFTNLSSGATTGYAWNFGDPASGAANTSALAAPSHLFSGVGTYNVCLTAKYANPACSNTYCANVVIYNPPVASFTFAPNNQCSGDPVQFTNTSLGNGLSYSWNFGDPASGGNNTSTLTNPQHQFAAYGAGSSSYTVSLVVTNAGGCTNTITTVVTVLQRPNASLTDAITNFNNCSQATAGNPDFTVTVTNTSTTTAINTNYSISWGDGSPSYNSSTFTTLTHTYTSLGVFTLTFIVTGSNGCTDTAIYNVLNISNPGISIGSPGSTNGCGPKTYCFPVNSYQQNDISTTYTMNFGDGSPVMTYSHPPPDTICHTYTKTSCGQPGNQFTATITAINSCASTPVSVGNIKIYTPPVTGLKILPDSIGCVKQAFTFQNTTTGAFNNVCSNTTTFTWDFGDGSPPVVTVSTGNQSHAYTNAGQYWVTLSSANYCSPDVSDSVLVCVNAAPVPGFVLSDTTGCAPLTITSNNTTVVTNTCGTTLYTWTVAFLSSTCNPMAGIWSFTGGTNANSVNPTFLFTDPGTYTISMQVNNQCIVNLSQNIVVSDSPTVKVAAIADFCGAASINPAATYASCYDSISIYSWSFAGGTPVSSALQIPGTVDYTTPGAFTVLASATNACGTKSDSVIFNVHPLPTIVPIALPDTICAGQSSALSVSGALKYKWTPATGLNKDTTNAVTATPLVTTTYTCVGTDAFGCMDTDSVVIVVNPIVPITVDPVTPVLCVGDSAQLTASGATIYTWFPSTGLSSNSGATVYAHPAATTIYTVKDTSGAGCPSIGTDTVNVNPLPNVAVNPPNPAICPIGSVNLTASGAASYTWFPATGLSATTGIMVTASPAVTTTYTVTGTGANGCIDSAVVTVTVNTTIPVDAGPDTVICIGSSIKLTPAGALSYEWSPAIDLSCTACTNPNASPAATIVYTVTGTDSHGCTGTDTVTVQVNTTLPVTVGPDLNVCPGTNTQLNVVAPSATTYLWNPTIGLSCSNCPNPIVNPPSSTTYTVSATGVCTGTASITINLYTPPIANAGPDVFICVGGDTLLNPSGGVSYDWSPATGLSCTACQNPSASPVTTTVYVVTVTDTNGCTATDNVTVNVLNALNVDAGPDQSICTGSSTQLNVVVPGASNYSWTPLLGLSCTNCPNPIASPADTTTYIITASNTGCTGSDTVTINVVTIPVANAGPDVSICDGSFITLNASGGADYNWFPMQGISNPSIANPFASPTVTTTYIVTVSNPPCSSTDTVVVTVDSIPVVTVSNDTLICSGTSINLNAAGAVIYNWLPVSGLNNPNIDNPIASPAVTTTYIVTGNDAVGCSSSASLTVSVVQSAKANAGQGAQICLGESTQLNATGGTDYLWLPSLGLSDSTISNPIASPGNTITYTVFVTDGTICPLTADTVTVTVYPLPLINAWPDTTIVAGASVTLNVEGSGTDYLWSPGSDLSCTTCLSPVASPLQTTSYIVSTSDIDGCRNSDTVVVNVEDMITLYIPNSFNPGSHNSDNNVFRAYGVGVEEFEFYIYNRWGEQIFVSKNLEEGWDGTYKGSPVSEDVYLYVAKATSVTGKSVTKAGTVTLVR